MKVWELIAELSKHEAGREVRITQLNRDTPYMLDITEIDSSNSLSDGDDVTIYTKKD